LIVDAHCHIGPAYAPAGLPPTGPKEVVKTIDENGIDIAVISQLTKDYKEDIEQVANAVREYPTRIVGFAHINPHCQDACRELDRAVNDLGLKGVKVHPALDGFAIHDEIMYPIVERARDLKVPILTHAGWAGIGCGCLFAQPLELLYLAELYPDVCMIMGHMGGDENYWPSAIKAAKKADNIILDTSAFCIPHVIQRAARDVGAERMIFGSDFPWTFQRLELQKIRMLNLTEREKDMILGKNMLRILKME